MPRIILACLLLAALTAAIPVPEVMAEGAKFTPLLDLRVRQEVLDGVLYFTSEPDRQWMRFRTRAGLKVASEHHAGTFRLANEHLHQRATLNLCSRLWLTQPNISKKAS